MKKINKLTESDLKRIVKRVINEQSGAQTTATPSNNPQMGPTNPSRPPQPPKPQIVGRDKVLPELFKLKQNVRGPLRGTFILGSAGEYIRFRTDSGQEVTINITT